MKSHTQNTPAQGRLTMFLRAGEIIFSIEPLEITTVLGSCVSVWLIDPKLGHSSISHFKAPAWDPRRPASPMYADIAIGRQIEGMISLGSRRRNLMAYVIGGGNVIRTPGNIGRGNIEAAMGILKREGIGVSYRNTGGFEGRKVVFNTAEGSLLIKKVPMLRAWAKPQAGAP